MSRARFHKLPADKREYILRMAANEFGTHTYKDASLNRILKNAGLTKGVAYYYFEDKADLYQAVLEHYLDHLSPRGQIELEHVRAENFWPGLARFYRRHILQLRENPWMLGISRSLSTVPEAVLKTHVAEALERIQTWIGDLIRRGRQHGVLRNDMSVELLQGLMMAVDGASDEWLVAHIAELDEPACEAHAEMLVDCMKRLLSPHPSTS